MTQSAGEAKLTPLDDQGRRIRDRLARRLRGEGLEIGALSHPMQVDPARVRVKYVDCMNVDQLRENYPEKDDERFVTPDFVCTGETLEGIPDGSQDFVISSHVLEHLEDPLGMLGEWHRVLNVGGLLYLAVPDKRFTPDRDRPRTPLSHLIQDHQDGGRSSREGHIREFGRAHLGLKTEEVLRGFVRRVDQIDYKVHFHVWLPQDLLEILRHMDVEMGLGWELLEMIEAENEAILLLRKPGRGGDR